MAVASTQIQIAPLSSTLLVTVNKHKMKHELPLYSTQQHRAEQGPGFQDVIPTLEAQTEAEMRAMRAFHEDNRQMRTQLAEAHVG